MDILAFQRKVLTFYRKHGRSLPWRSTADPYKILVSEVMLQQTQVDRVIPYYERWMGRWPDAESLAKAEKEDVLRMWQGLGYNNRALRLWEAGKEVTGLKSFPRTYDELIKLKGIGEYTANAVLAFAFNKEVPVLDTNIRRVLIHELGLKEKIGGDQLKKVALGCVPKGKSRIWHNALMDYGALRATARKTKISSLSKQGKFEGSTRQVRAAVIRELLKRSACSVTELKKRFPHPKFDEILERMLKERLVKKEGRKIKI